MYARLLDNKREMCAVRCRCFVVVVVSPVPLSVSISLAWESARCSRTHTHTNTYISRSHCGFPFLDKSIRTFHICILKESKSCQPNEWTKRPKVRERKSALQTFRSRQWIWFDLFILFLHSIARRICSVRCHFEMGKIALGLSLSCACISLFSCFGGHEQQTHKHNVLRVWNIHKAAATKSLPITKDPFAFSFWKCSAQILSQLRKENKRKRQRQRIGESSSESYAHRRWKDKQAKRPINIPHTHTVYWQYSIWAAASAVAWIS